MKDNLDPEKQSPWWEDSLVNDPSNPGHFQAVSSPEDTQKVTSLGKTPVEEIAVEEPYEDSEPETEEIEVVIPDNTVTFYDHSYHFKSIFKMFAVSKFYKSMYGIGCLAVIACIVLILTGTAQASLYVTLILVCTTPICFAYPTMRLRFWWRNRRIIVAAEPGRATFTLEQPQSRFYNLLGSAGTSFILTGNVSINLKHETRWELYVFRKSGGGNIGTTLQDDEDKELKNLHDIYMPQQLKQAINDAMNMAEGR